MNISFTFFSLIEDRYFYGFEKKIKSITKNLNILGFRSNYINVNDLSIKGIIKFSKLIYRSNSTFLIVRMIGLKSFLLLFLLIFVRRKIFIEVPTSFTTVNYEFKISQNKNFKGYFYYTLNFIITPLLLFFYPKIIYYHKENFPYNIFIKKKIFMWAHGIEVDNILLKSKLTKINNNKIKFVCIGSLAKWHGLDRLLKSITFYQRLNNIYKFQINLVGHIDSSVFSDPNLINEYKKNNNEIIFHGLKKDEALFNVIKDSNIALGSLGLSCLKNYNRSELKIREYTAYGIPFLMEANDSDFKKNNNFIFFVNKNEHIINIGDVINWYNRLDDRICKEMRDFAYLKLDYKIKIKQFINEIF
jgi:glycosyltransferase involved in cell wall biosynthesis